MFFLHWWIYFCMRIRNLNGLLGCELPDPASSIWKLLRHSFQSNSTKSWNQFSIWLIKSRGQFKWSQLRFTFFYGFLCPDWMAAGSLSVTISATGAPVSHISGRDRLERLGQWQRPQSVYCQGIDSNIDSCSTRPGTHRWSWSTQIIRYSNH